VRARRPAPRWRIKSTPTITESTTETSCSQKCGTSRASMRLMPCAIPLIIKRQPKAKTAANDDTAGYTSARMPENHHTALYEIPKRMPLDLFAHCLAHDSGGSME
jgi:hypothetical protein